MPGRKRSETVAALRQVPLLRDLSKRDLGFIATLASGYVVEPERALVVQGERQGGCMIILSGRARVERDGRTFAHLGPGDVVGEMSLLDGRPRAATVVAEDWTEVIALDNRDFTTLLKSSPELQHQLLLSLCARLRDADELLVS